MRTQPDALALPTRLRHRLETLPLSLLTLRADGRAAWAGHRRPLERAIIASPLFQSRVRQVWPRLRGGAEGEVQLWPGCWLAPVPTATGARLRRVLGTAQEETRQVAMMLTPAILDSEQLRQICDSQQLDFQAVVARNDPSTLLSEAEMARIAGLIGWLAQDAHELDRRSAALTNLSQQLGDCYEELSLLYKLSANMLVSQAPAQFIAHACTELLQVVELRWVALHLAGDEARLHALVGSLFTAGTVGCDSATLSRVGEQLLRRVAAADQPLVIDNVSGLNIAGIQGIAANLLAVPLLRGRKPIGILFGADKLDGTPISSVDTKLCGSLAGSLSIFLENTVLYEDVQAMFMGTLHALTSAIDAKDSYTHGHSERVALLSRMLARAAGLDDEAVERVYLCGLVHDVGKIGVPEAVLCKPGALTRAEFDLVKQHPVIGARILQDIRQMDDLIPGVLHHHERWDGGGYPAGLTGQDIPLFGRLICLADSYDAMSSSRTYRGAMNPEQACAEIRRCTGTQFDSALAPIFVELDFAPFLELLEGHQRRSPTALGPAGSHTP